MQYLQRPISLQLLLHFNLFFAIQLSGINLSIDITPLYYYLDKSGSTSQKIVSRQEFNSYPDDLQIPLQTHQAVWFKFEILNSDDLSQFGYLETNLFQIDGFLGQMDLFDLSNSEVQKAGAWLGGNELTVPENRFAFRILVLPRSQKNYLLKVTSLRKGNLTPVQLQLISKTELNQSHDDFRLSYYQDTLITQGFFWGTVFFCLVLAGYQYYWYREQAYGLYLLYVFCLSLLYLRGIEGPFGDYFSLHAGWGQYIHSAEIPLQYLIVGFYLRFAYTFLDIKKYRNHKIDMLLFYFSNFFLSMAVLDILIQTIIGTELSRNIYDLIRLPLSPFAFMMIFYILYKYRSPLNTYVLIGTMLLCIPSVFTAFSNLATGTFGYESRISLLRIFKFYDSPFQLYMYHTRLGVMLDILCFALALSYKNKWSIEQLKQENVTTIATPSVKVSDPLTEQVRQLVMSKISEDLPIDAICRTLTISRSQLHYRLKSATGVSASIFIRSIRLEEGRRLLISTNLSIAEIAYQTGFADPNYFTRTFTKEYGMSPKRMRQGQEVK